MALSHRKKDAEAFYETLFDTYPESKEIYVQEINMR
jgi:hemoglobin-like flavoprotein